ncbi:hypothetical protein ScPMuIL_017066 [Solemya velum]
MTYCPIPSLFRDIFYKLTHIIVFKHDLTAYIDNSSTFHGQLGAESGAANETQFLDDHCGDRLTILESTHAESLARQNDVTILYGASF